MKRHYEEDGASFPDEAYKIPSICKGIAFYALGWETASDEDTEWSGHEPRTGRVVVVMVGDDRHFTCDEEDLVPIEESEYCPECGQLGCRAYK